TAFVRPGADASRYRLLVVPALIAMSTKTAAWLRDYVEAGGRLVVTYLSALTDENQRVGLGGYPAVLRELLGITVSELLPLAPEEAVHLDDGSRASEWVERVRLADASALTSYRDGPVAGRPAVTSVARGRGTAVYLSARLVQEDRDALLLAQAQEAGIGPVLPGASGLGVEAVRRRAAPAAYLFLLHRRRGAAGRGRRRRGACGARGRARGGAGLICALRAAAGPLLLRRGAPALSAPRGGGAPRRRRARRRCR